MPLERGRHPRPTIPPQTCSHPRHGQKEAPEVSGAELRREPSSYNEKGRQWCRPSPSRSELG